MEDRLLIQTFQEKINQIYNSQKLYPLSGLDNSFMLPNGKQFMIWYTEITTKRNCSVKGFYDYTNLLDDLLIISDEIVYFTAHLYFYRPHSNSPLKDSYMSPNGKYIYPVFQNLEGKRYQMFINICFEKVYNFWDRIGDLIASYFPHLFKKNIYFSQVLEKIKFEYIGNEDFDWLLNFYQSEFKNFNLQRIKTVHTININTEIKREQLNHVTDLQKTLDLNNKIQSYPEKFKELNKLSIEGFEKTLNFLEYINKTEGYNC